MLDKKKKVGKIYNWEKFGKFIYGQTKTHSLTRTSIVLKFFYNPATDIGVCETLNSRYLLYNRDSKKNRRRHY